jgi:hypothetical protein
VILYGQNEFAGVLTFRQRGPAGDGRPAGGPEGVEPAKADVTPDPEALEPRPERLGREGRADIEGSQDGEDGQYRMTPPSESPHHG